MNGQEGDEKDCPTEINFKIEDFQIISVKWAYLNKYLIAATQTGELLKIDLKGNIFMQKKVHDLDLKFITFAKDFSFIMTAGKEGSKMIDPETFESFRSFKQEV